MRVSADRSVCVGAGLCALTAPTVFDQGEDDGLVRVRAAAPDADSVAAVREAADICPSGAVSFTE
ncbi:ferredoxin [Nocardia brasiliensis]|uniref:Ferredoxin n=1 Tax=Nocardia brasiliensis TaxID=37326 RepID=A0A6G9XRF6_NOCBR|nr:(4Fe-4S)-binding protein [Nocardia brasiliensis]QIS03488.1 ferredoxin [Nocardia brasiliensis]